MDKEKLQHTLNTTKNLKEIAKEFNISITTVRYWISKHEIKKENTCLENCLVCAKKCKKLYCSLTCKKKDYYENNKEHLKTISKEYCKNNREIFKKLAINYGGSKCKHCGYNNNYSALAFHHLDPDQKDFALGSIRSKTLTPSLRSELDKCILLCHNCHNIEHNKLRLLENNLKNKQAIKGQKVRRELIDLKGGECKKCKVKGINDIFAFHHRIESEKEFNIDARVCNGYKYERLLKEIAKCDLLCHNCHSETHNPLCTL